MIIIVHEMLSVFHSYLSATVYGISMRNSFTDKFVISRCES
jgi:hypothetical protein